MKGTKMKYSEMNEEQKTEYKARQIENQRIARQRAKVNTTIINMHIELTDAQVSALGDLLKVVK